MGETLAAALGTVDHTMRAACAQRVFPGAVLLVARANRILLHRAYGYANLLARRPTTIDTIFDLASLTKPLATATAIIKLVTERRLLLEIPLGTILSETKKSATRQVTVKQLLCHKSGLPDYRPFYKKLLTFPKKIRIEKLRQLLIEEPLLHPPGASSKYSDLGFMLLEWVIAEVTGSRLDQFVVRDIYEPLGATLYFVEHFGERRSGTFAATEVCPWRNTPLEGVVHDENAYVVGGIGGHAGLFGRAIDIYVLLRELLNTYHGRPSRALFARDVLRGFLQRQAKTDFALGFDTPAAKGSSSGRFFARNSIGHLGFTGTSFWVDLDRAVTVILLTNRIHPTRANEQIKAFRPELHDAIMLALGLAGGANPAS